MKILNVSAALLAAGLLIAGPALAQTSPAPVQKQKTQEGGPSFAPLPCGGPEHANASADPNCKQRTQSMSPTSVQSAGGTAAPK